MTGLTDLIAVSTIESLLSEALGRGGDFADVFVERSVLNSVVIDEGKVKSGGYRVAMDFPIYGSQVVLSFRATQPHSISR